MLAITVVDSEILHAEGGEKHKVFGFTSTNLGTYQIMNGWRRNASIKSASPSGKIANIFQHHKGFGMELE